MTMMLNFSHAAYDNLVRETVQEIVRLGKEKGAEYAGDENRLENFVRNAKALALEPEQVWAVYAGKHWDAIVQYVQDMQTGKERKRTESMEGRFDDLIVYALLGKAMYRARHLPQQDPNANVDGDEAETKTTQPAYVPR